VCYNDKKVVEGVFVLRFSMRHFMQIKEDSGRTSSRLSFLENRIQEVGCKSNQPTTTLNAGDFRPSY
jgi:hypothetical protein